MELLKSALRQLRARKLASALTLLLLAVGIGANTAIFSVVDSVLLKPLPYPDSGDLVLVRKVFPPGGPVLPGGGERTPDIEFSAWVNAVPKSFRTLAGYKNGSAALTAGDESSMVAIADVTEGFFPMLGIHAWRGRLPVTADCVAGAPPVVVLSYARWMSQFDGEDSAIGRVVKIDDTAATIIGVLPATFEFVDAVDYWRPLPVGGLGAPGELRIQLITIFGRLLPGTDLKIAAQELDGISEQFWTNPLGSFGAQMRQGPPAAATTAGSTEPQRRIVRASRPAPEGATPPPDGVGSQVVREAAAPTVSNAGPPQGERRMVIRSPLAEGKTQLVPLQEHLVKQSRSTLWLLLGAVGFVLLIACANIASLQLARAEGRRREMAVRAALGASPRRLFAELLLENVMLAAGGGLLGVLFALWGVQALSAWLATQLPRMSPVAVDAPVLGFAVALSIAAGLLFGTMPALRARRVDLLESLKEGGQLGSRSGHRLRQWLVGAEVTLAVMLAINTGMLAKSVYEISSYNPGFRTEDAMTASVSLPRRYATPAQQRDFASRWLDEIRSMPGVKEAAVSDMPPLTPYNRVMMIAESRTTTGNTDASIDAPPRRVAIMTVSPDYFRALGIPLIDGRLLSDSDIDGAPDVAVVNEAYVKVNFPTGTPIGTSIDLPFGGHMAAEESQGATIVGVVGDVRPGGIESTSQPLAYYPASQHPQPRYTAIVHFAGSGNDIARGIAQAAHRTDPSLAITAPATIGDQIARQNAPRRVTFLLTAAFAATAIVLAGIGIFGVMTYTVAQRTQEIGVRMALGADGSRILRWIMSYGGIAIGGGLLAGVVLTISLGRVLATVLSDIASLDPAVVLGAVLFLAMTGAAACLAPAMRATRVNPVEALREG